MTSVHKTQDHLEGEVNVPAYSCCVVQDYDIQSALLWPNTKK